MTLSPLMAAAGGRLKTLSSLLLSRFAGTALQLAFTVLVARAFGAIASGYLFTWMAWSIFAAAMLSLGAPAFVLREVSKIGRDERLAMGRIYAQITIAAYGATALVAGVGAVVPWSLPAPYGRLLLFSIVSGHAILMLEVATSALIATGRENAGIFLRFIGPPLAMCLLLLAFVAAGTVPDVEAIVATYVAAVLVLAVISDRLYRLWAGPSRHVSEADSAVTRRRLWSINVVNALYMGFPFFVLPYVAGAREIAYFAIGYRITNVAQTASVALGSYFSPRFARAQRNHDSRHLRRLFHSSQLISLAILSPLLIFVTPLGPLALRLFGAEFAGAWAYVAIPAAARLLIAGCGLTEQFLAMTHNERSEVLVSSGALLLLAGAAFATVRSYGALGLCVVFYGVSILKFAVACLVSLLALYRTNMVGAAIQPEGHRALDVPQV